MAQDAPELEIRGVGCEQTNTHITAFVSVHRSAAHLMVQEQ